MSKPIILQELEDSNVSSINLQSGLQIINSEKDALVNALSINGRTLVNLLGRDGNCEDVSKWTLNANGTITLDTAQFVLGSSSIKVASSSVQGYILRSKSSVSGLDATKYHVFVAHVKNGNATSVRIEGTGGATSASISATDKFYPVFARFTPANIASMTNFAFVVTGSTGQYGYVDGMRLYQITQAEYDSMATMTADQVASIYPYVDDVKHVNAVYIKNYGKNLLPPFSEWTLNATSLVTGDYSLTINANALGNDVFIDIPCLPNTSYTLSASTTEWIAMNTLDANKNIVRNNGRYKSPYTITTASTGEAYLRLYMSNLSTSGSLTWSNPMLNIGSTALPFEPQKQSYLYFPTCNLRSSVDRSVADKMYNDGEGKPRVTRQFREVGIDGSLTYTYGGDGVGYKYVITSSLGVTYKPTNRQVVKYDGKILNYNESTNASDQFAFNGSGSLYIVISDNDSGWGESYTPTSAEIQAYFYGYRMYDSNTYTATQAQAGAGTYNGTGTKNWVNIYGTVAATAGVLPTSQHTSFTPYRLIYQLAQSVDEAATYEGEIMLHSGSNQIEVGTGVVLREAAKPAIDGGNTYVAIGNKVSASYATSSQLKYRPSSITNVYKDGVRDVWRRSTSGVSLDGKEIAYTDYSLYDQTSAYSVTYLALDAYTLGIAPTSIAAECTSNLKGIVDKLAREVAESKIGLSVIQSQKVQKQSPQWITPTLLNGWVNFGSGYPEVGYYKDDSGRVYIKGMIKSGTIGVVVFYFPAGYRPKDITYLNAVSNGAFAYARVLPDGTFRIDTGVNSDVAFNVSFRAEQ